MAASLPDGATVHLATVYDSIDAISSITNAATAEASAAAHGMADGDFAVIKSGWNKINEKVIRVSGSTSDKFLLTGVDTSDATQFSPGASAGSAQRVATWTQIAQVLSFEMSGGDQQFATFSFLEEDFERQLPTVTSARSIRIGIADDPTLAGFQALKALEGKRVMRALKLNLPNGAVLLYNGIVAFNSTPTLTKGNVMEVSASFSLQGPPTRY